MILQDRTNSFKGNPLLISCLIKLDLISLGAFFNPCFDLSIPTILIFGNSFLFQIVKKLFYIQCLKF